MTTSCRCVGLINRQPFGMAETEVHYAVTVVCRAAEEAHVRALLFQGIHIGQLHLRGLDGVDLDNSDRVQVTASVDSEVT